MQLRKKYDPHEAEPRLARQWNDAGLYAFNPHSSAECFSVDTPPPYVSADHLHAGHVMSYSQAEFIVRYKRMRGLNVFYPMGFDDNGLPTERFVEAKHHVDKATIDRKEFVRMCLAETAEGAATYRRLWERLGISVDWSLCYSTMDERSRRTAQASFLDLQTRGLIERREEPIQWCFACGTSPAQADVASVEQAGRLHDIAFGGGLVISTTRPELLPACVALYAHPDDARYSPLLGTDATVPIFGHRVPVRAHPDVDPTFGTGLMMVCTWGDSEDVAKWRADHLDTRIIFAADGTLSDGAGILRGMRPQDARRAVIEALTAQGLLVGSRPVTHAVGTHERCGSPVEFNLALQWFIRILDHKQRFLELGDRLAWYPRFMKARYDEWVSGLKWDWCISRQRFYGVPFPVWYCVNCSTPLLADRQSLPVDPTVTQPSTGTRCACGSAQFRGEPDVMDTWMTSSLSPLINGNWAFGDSARMSMTYPNSVRVQAFEIIRTWLFYTIVKAEYHTGGLPWRSVMISGWGLDAEGRKLSKRLGNFVDPMEIITKYSADAMRYWAAGSSLGHDLRYSESRIADGQRLCTKLWNAGRLIGGHLADEARPSVPDPACMSVADRWILRRFGIAVTDASRAFEEFDYSHALEAAEQFLQADLCDNYLEIVKPRLWEGSTASPQTMECTRAILVQTFRGTLKLLAPFLPFVTEEIHGLLFAALSDAKSIHVSQWPQAPELAWDARDEEQSRVLLSLLGAVRKWKSNARLNAGAPLSSVRIACSHERRDTCCAIADDLRSGVRATDVGFAESGSVETGIEGITLEVTAR